MGVKNINEFQQRNIDNFNLVVEDDPNVKYFSFGSKMLPKTERESASPNRKSGCLRVDTTRPLIVELKDEAVISPPCLQQSVSSPSENSDDGAPAAGGSGSRPICSVQDVDQQRD